MALGSLADRPDTAPDLPQISLPLGVFPLLLGTFINSSLRNTVRAINAISRPPDKTGGPD